MGPILVNLTQDDLRLLMIGEDELERAGTSRRVYPNENMSRYRELTGTNNYYYKLLEAWENKFGRRREEGRDLLRQLSKDMMPS